MVSGQETKRLYGLLFALLALIGFGCQAVHEDVIVFDREEIVMEEDEQVRRLLESGNSYLKSEIYPEAEKNYRKVLRIQPDSRTANINLSYVLRKQNRTPEAFDLDHQFTQRFPEDADGHARLAAAYAGDKSDLEGAASSMKRALALNGEEKSYHTDLGYYYTELEMYEDAIVAYEGALALDPDDETTEKVLIDLYKKTGDVGALVQSKEKQLEEDPENAGLLNDLAKLYRDQEDYIQAAEYYERLAPVAEKQAPVLRNLALCYLQVPDTLSALGTYKRVVEIDAEDNNSLVRLAELQVAPNVRRYDDAIRSVQTALNRNENNARGWCVWGKALENLKQYDQAKTKYNRAVALNDEVWSPYAEKELVRQDQLIERAKKLAEKEEYEATEFGD